MPDLHKNDIIIYHNAERKDKIIVKSKKKREMPIYIQNVVNLIQF